MVFLHLLVKSSVKTWEFTITYTWESRTEKKIIRQHNQIHINTLELVGGQKCSILILCNVSFSSNQSKISQGISFPSIFSLPGTFIYIYFTTYHSFFIQACFHFISYSLYGFSTHMFSQLNPIVCYDDMILKMKLDMGIFFY